MAKPSTTVLGASFYNSPFARCPNEPSDPRVAAARSVLNEQQGGSDPYGAARERVLSLALAQGYDAATMTEHGVLWGEDQDPFGHVNNASFPHFLSHCNYRVMEGMERFIGVEHAEKMRRGKGVGPVVRGYEVSVRRSVSYPDALITANRLTAVKPDRYQGVTTTWSLRQETVVAESFGWIVWVDLSTGKKCDLEKKGGVWKDMYHGLVGMVEASKQARAEWEKERGLQGLGSKL